MKKSRYSDKQIIGMLKQHEAGVKTSELCRKHGISAATFYGWKSKFGGRNVKEAQRLKQLEDENCRLKMLVAELRLHGEALKLDREIVASDLTHNNKYPAELPNEPQKDLRIVVPKRRPLVFTYDDTCDSFPDAQSSTAKNDPATSPVELATSAVCTIASPMQQPHNTTSNTLEQEVTARYLLDRRLKHQRAFVFEFNVNGLRFFHDKFIPEGDVNAFTDAFDELVTLRCSRVTLASALYCFCQSYPGSSEPEMDPVPFPTQKMINKYVATLREAEKTIAALHSYHFMDELAQWAGFKEIPQGDIYKQLEWYIGALSKWCRPRKDIVKSYAPIALCMYAKVATGKYQFPAVSILLQSFGYRPDQNRRRRARGAGLGFNTPESLERNFRNFTSAHPVFCQQLELSVAGDDLLVKLLREEEYERWFDEENISREYMMTEEACDEFDERFSSYLEEHLSKQFNWTNIFSSHLPARNEDQHIEALIKFCTDGVVYIKRSSNA